MAVVQSVWILAVPPFRASDEFDHVYRAAGVASGQWLLDQPAVDGRGLYVDIPADIVRAASAQCESLDYPGPDNCRPAQVTPEGRWRVATAAGPYNPVFYAVVGTAARPFAGDAALYVMRGVGAALCLVVVLAALAVALSQRPGRWERLGLLVALTPVVTFSTAIPAPNGLEMAAGLLTWCSLLAVARERRPDLVGWYLAAGAAGVALLGSVRMLGPLWLALICLVVLVVGGTGPWRRLWGRHRGGLVLAAGAGTAGVMWGAVWVVVSRWYAVEETGAGRPADLAVLLLRQSFTWVMQLTAAFPFRDVPAPLAVYPTVMVLVVTAVLVAVRRGSPRERCAIVVAVLLAVIVPVALTVVTVDRQGVVWQGRYLSAFVVGIVPLCGHVLDRTRWAPWEGGRLSLIAAVMVAGVYSACIHRVVASEELRGRVDPELDWAHLPPVVLSVAAAAAIVGCAAALLWSGPGRRQWTAPDRPARDERDSAGTRTAV
nr:DUF2142 domain-containing protein [Nocardioides flavescens]